jgi:hypothetical protein
MLLKLVIFNIIIIINNINAQKVDILMPNVTTNKVNNFIIVSFFILFSLGHIFYSSNPYFAFPNSKYI